METWGGVESLSFLYATGIYEDIKKFSMLKVVLCHGLVYYTPTT